jgi:hypothetical protein
MDLTILPADKGDCLLLTGQDGRRMLVDGGMKSSYTRYVAPLLGDIAADGGKIDVVYVSHIDEDHIAGVLQLADDLLAWKIFDRIHGEDAEYREPNAPRPPAFDELWHNGFHEQIGENAGDIEGLLIGMATVLSGHPDSSMRLISSEQRNLAASENQATLLQRRLGKNQLGVPLNRPANGRLMMVREGNQPISLGGLTFHILAPFSQDLEDLREKWVKWLKSARGKEQLAAIRKDARDKERLLRASELDLFKQSLESDAKKLGNREDVTTPNLASLMLLVEEGAHSLLLTGDGHADEVISGLKNLKKLSSRRRGLHVDICKIPHHGAVANMTEEFASKITADHYVFCGNGGDDNPEEAVVKLIIDSRIGSAEQRSTNREVDQQFKLWFSCSSEFENLSIARSKHMRGIERLVEDRARESGGQMTYEFLRDRPLVVHV